MQTALERDLQADKPRFRLALGRDAVACIRAERRTLGEELDTWEAMAIGADHRSGVHDSPDLDNDISCGS
jgi:hypothetical protein